MTIKIGKNRKVLDGSFKKVVKINRMSVFIGEVVGESGEGESVKYDGNL